MADAQLVKYIKNQIKTGYSSDQIRTQLTKQGYALPVVNNAIKEANQDRFPHILLWAGIISLVILIIILSSIVYMKMNATDDKIIEKQTTEKTIKQQMQEEQIMTETAETTKEKIKETITEETTLYEKEQQEKETIIETQTFQATNEIEQAKQASTTDVERAQRICADLLTRQEKDACFLTIAKSAEKLNLCDKISAGATKDQCYFSFAVQGEDTCAQITDEEVKKDCEQLIKLDLPLS